MNLDAASLGILWPAFIAGLLVTVTHVPLGMQVLARGIVFVDLAVAQIAGVGVILADYLGWEPTGAAVQIAALSAALGCAMMLTWTERRWPEVQEAIIGVVFVLGSSIAILLLAHNPRGGENLKELLIGQILWVNPSHFLIYAAIYAVVRHAGEARPDRVLCLVRLHRNRLGAAGGLVSGIRYARCSGTFDLLHKRPPPSEGLLRRRARLRCRPARVAVA